MRNDRFRPRRSPVPAPDPIPVTVDLHGLAVGGAAVGKVTSGEGDLAGMTAFVPFAAPGETVTARVRKQAKRYLEAELAAVETPSPHRVEPRCPHFGVCGGCDLQHMEYAAQLREKREMVCGALRTGGLSELVDLVGEVVSGPPYAYRQRIGLHLDKQGRTGYFVRRSYRLLIPQTCPISLPAIDQWLAEGSITFEDILQGVEGDLAVEAAENGLFGVLRLAKAPPHEVVEQIVERMGTRFVGGSVQSGGKTLGRFGREGMLRTIGGIERHAAPGVFSQVNPAVNSALIARVMEVAESLHAKSAYDFYSGSGNFALPLATSGVKVIAVESDPVLVSFGRSETKRSGLNERVVFYEGDMEKFMQRPLHSVDLAIADPPRAGLGPLAEKFTFTQNLILISCELPSAVRDLKALAEIGWKPKAITPFDMFAQTANVELLTVLER